MHTKIPVQINLATQKKQHIVTIFACVQECSSNLSVQIAYF